MAFLTGVLLIKIKAPYFLTEKKSNVKIELQNLLSQPSDKDERPCPDCQVTFPSDSNIVSTDNCSYACPFAACQMSTEPDRYPIEPHVAPLVYAFYTLRLLMPCWSCEGHTDKNKKIIKMPQIWFYSASPFYAKLVAEALEDMKSQGLIKYNWEVRILAFSQSKFTLTYCINPLFFSVVKYRLSVLHDDLLVIGKRLRIEMLNLAHQYIEEVNEPPFSNK